MYRRNLVEQALENNRAWFKEYKPLDPNSVYGTDVLDFDMSFSEREVVIAVLNKEFKFKIKLKHPKAYYDGDAEYDGDVNKKAVKMLIKDLWREIRDFAPETIGEQKYIILQMEKMIKSMKSNLKQDILHEVDKPHHQR